MYYYSSSYHTFTKNTNMTLMLTMMNLMLNRMWTIRPRQLRPNWKGILVRRVTVQQVINLKRALKPKKFKKPDCYKCEM
jgi:hypothetical protein